MDTINNITQNAQNIPQKLLQKSCEAQENLKQQLKKLGLATLGAFSVYQEQAEEKIKQFVDKGTEVEKDLNEWVHGLWKKGYHETKETIHDVEKTLEISNLLNKMNIPSKNDVETLAKKVEELNNKIDEMILAAKSVPAQAVTKDEVVVASTPAPPAKEEIIVTATKEV